MNLIIFGNACKRNVKIILPVIPMILILVAIPITPGFSIDPDSEQSKPFLDWDGDGFNDNLDDYDDDGIPDKADPDYAELHSMPYSSGAQEENLIDFGTALPASDLEYEEVANSDRFGGRKFGARALTQDRCGFTSEECCGTESGIGIISSGGGGACSGGVCH